MSSYRLHDSLGYQLSVTARLHKSRFDDMLKEMGLTRTTWCVLLAVCTEGLSRPSEIAGFIGIDRNLGQEAAIDAVWQETQLMDDSLSAMAFRRLELPGATYWFGAATPR